MTTDAGLDWESFLKIAKGADSVLANLYDPQDQHLRQQAVRSLAQSLAQGYHALMNLDVDRPSFISLFNTLVVCGAPNPDFTYYGCGISSKGVYRIFGERGTSRFIIFGTGASLFGGNEKRGPSYANYEVDDLEIAPDGTFEVILSTERPAGHTGNWWYLDSRATEMFVRQGSCDWDTEVDGRFGIERLDVPATGRQWTNGGLASDLKRLAQFPERFLGFLLQHTTQLKDRGFINKVDATKFADVGGATNQLYYEGIFDIAADEALILDTEIPEKAKYWSLHLTDLLWQTLDWVNCQSSLNDHQARPDSDGRFRAVLSLTDPGVPNWIDTVGLLKGVFLGRWNNCSSYPMPTITRVKLADLRNHLPKDTPVVTPAQRQEQLRIRRRGAQLRRKW